MIFTNTSIFSIKKLLSCLFILFILFISTVNTFQVYSQESSDSLTATSEAQSTSDSTKKFKSNKATKLLLNELKKGSDDSLLTTLAMIGGVLVIVGIAMYISFKDDPDKKKAKL
jgi:hypothetical protein